MKIITKGNPKKAWSKEVSCTGKGNGNAGCRARLQISEGDLYYTEGSYFAGSKTYITFTCPCCGTKTDVRSIPGSVKIHRDEQEYLGSKQIS